MTRNERRDFARSVPRPYVHRYSRPNAPIEHGGTIYRVDGIGPKSAMPISRQPGPTRGFWPALVWALLIAASLWALFAALDAPAHLGAR